MSDEQMPSSDEQWSLLEGRLRDGGLVVGKVIEANEQSLLVTVGGIKGRVASWPFLFMWSASAEVESTENWDPQMLDMSTDRLLSQEILLKVTEVDRHADHLVLAIPTYTDAEKHRRNLRHLELLQSTPVGTVLQGRVVVIGNQGVIVDLDGLRGWLPPTNVGLYNLHLMQLVEVTLRRKMKAVALCTNLRVL